MSDETTPKDEMDEVEGHKQYGRQASANDEPTDEGTDDEVEAHKFASKPEVAKPEVA